MEFPDPATVPHEHLWILVMCSPYELLFGRVNFINKSQSQGLRQARGTGRVCPSQETRMLVRSVPASRRHSSTRCHAGMLSPKAQNEVSLRGTPDLCDMPLINNGLGGVYRVLWEIWKQIPQTMPREKASGLPLCSETQRAHHVF